MANNTSAGYGDSPPIPSSGSGITRRVFLASSSALAILASEAARAQQSPPFFSSEDGIISLVWGKGSSARTWQLDPDWFVLEGKGQPNRRAIRLINPQTVEIRGRFAGANIPANFQISVVERSGRWQLEWTYERQRLPSISVSDWFAGHGIPILIRRLIDISSASSALELRGRLAGTIRLPFSLRLKPEVGASVDFRLGQSSGTTGSLRVEVYNIPASAALEGRLVLTDNVASLLPAGALPKVRVTADQLTLKDPTGGWPLGKIGDSTLRLAPALPKIIVEVVRLPDRRQYLVVWRHLSAGEAKLTIGSPETPRILFVEDAELIEVSNGRHGLACALTHHPRMIQGMRYAAFVRGHGGPQFHADYRGTDRISLLAMLQTLHVRGEDNGRYDIDFRDRSAEGNFLDRSAILWEQEAVGGVEAVLSLGRPPTALAPMENRLHLGTQSGISVLLHRPSASSLMGNGPVLRVRRHEDALDLGFLFHGYRLEVSNKGSRLIPGSDSQRGVRFHPQHLQEEVFDSPAGLMQSIWEATKSLGARLAGTTDPALKIRKLGQDALFAGDGITTKLARTRVSGSSRVVFAPETSAPQLPLSVEALTDWEDLALKVPLRADLANRSLEEQIQGIGINTETSRADAQQLVCRSLTEPKPCETALELITGLTFAPDSSARLRTPRRSPGEAAPIWTAQLELQPVRKSLNDVPAPSRVRAVWASGFRPEGLIGLGCGVQNPDGRDPSFEASLNARDRSEIMMLSSAVGVAALRAVTLTGLDVPYSMVRIPRAGGKPFKYVDPSTEPIPGSPGKEQVQQEGVMAPAAFSRFCARLTSFGADIDVEWHGEPTAPYPKNAFFKRAFSIEKYVHRTSLGSDILVEAVYKGFLLPYGFRVSLIKVTEREPWHSADMGAMMPGIQRYFILAKPVEKTFPGIYQPYNGLEIPVRHARLAFELSPELEKDDMMPPPGLIMPPAPEPKEDACAGEVGKARKPEGRVFWPTLKDLRSEILFDFIADDTRVRRSMPMLFADNTAVHHPATMRAILDYYNNIAEVRLRTELHHGGKTIYAAPNKSGDTSFETDHIIVKARSRLIPTPAQDSGGQGSMPSRAEATDAEFMMDAFMEGADEPPIYPVMVEASVRVPALDRLLGKPQGLKRVGYIGHYIRNGFDPRANPSELYLSFLESGLMNLNGRGEVSGGLSQTPTPIAGISRSNSVVGAATRPMPKALAPPSGASGTPPVGADEHAPWDLSEAIGDRFNPAKFFRLGKLLGIIDLGEVVKAATMAAQPKLREVYDYSAAAATEAADAVLRPLKEACLVASVAIRASLKQAEDALIQFILNETVPGWTVLPQTPGNEFPNVRSCYPDLTMRLVDIKTKLEVAAGAGSLGEIASQASAIMESWRGVKGAVDAVIANPSPEPIRGIIGQLRVLVDYLENELSETLRKEIEQRLNHLIAGLVHPIIEAVLDHCFDAAGKLINSWLFEAAFGKLWPPQSDGTLALAQAPTRDELRQLVLALIAKPSEVPQAVLTAPLSNALTLPLLRMIANARLLLNSIDEAEAAILERTAEAAHGAMRSVLETIASTYVLLEAAKTAAVDLCDAAASPLVKVVQVAADSLPSSGDLANAFKVIEDRMKKLDLPGLGNTPDVNAAREAAAGLRVAVQKVAIQINEIEKVRGAFRSDIPAWCREPGRVAVAVAELVRYRSGTVAALTDCANQSRLVTAALSKLPDAQVQEARIALHTVRRELVILCYRMTIAALTIGANGAKSELVQRLEPLGAVIYKRLSIVLNAVLDAGPVLAQQTDDFLALPGNAAELDEKFELIASAANALGNGERQLLALATDFTALPDKIRTPINLLMESLAARIGEPLIDLHQTVYDKAKDAVGLLEAAPDLVLLLSGPILARLKMARDAIKADLDALNRIRSHPEEASALVEQWKGGGAALATATRTMLELFTAVARGQVGALFSLEDARRAVEDTVRRLIPSQVTTTYVWDATLVPVPSGNPIFLPGKTSELKPAPKDGDFADLAIDTRIQVDLLNPRDRSVKVYGKLQPFAIHLLGESVDLVRIGFKETRFEIINGGAPKFFTKVDSVTIGQDLKFLSELQNYLSTSKSGFSIVPTYNPPGVRVAYAFAAPIIQLGALSILNLGFEIFALLPFDGSQALLGFSVGTKAQPFGIIVLPCYYGGGFVGLIATARGVVKFEIQLEFGAATAVEFGPLRGQGRVSTGIYLMASDDGTSVLEGFVHAIGEGQVACFGVCVNLEVKVRHEGEAMTGGADYEFTFRVGIAEVSYGVTASYTFKGGNSGALARGNIAKIAGGQRTYFNGLTSAQPYVLDAPDKLSDWLGYRSHFVEVWPT